MPRLPSTLLPNYAELHCLSSFSFLRGASSAEELVERAKELGYAALAITDECSMAGVVRAHQSAKHSGLKLIIGSEVRLDDGMKLVLLAQNRAGYGNLSAIITLARNRAGVEKGSYQLTRGDLARGIPDCLALWVAPADAKPEDADWLSRAFPDRCWIAFEHHLSAGDTEHLQYLQALSARCGIPLVASGDVHMHARGRRPLQDVLTALRLKTSVDLAGHALFSNGERHLRSRLRLARLYPPQLLAETLRIAALCNFSLDELRYEYPREVVPEGETPASYLRAEVMNGLDRRYPQGVSAKVLDRVEEELVLIAYKEYEPYFLTVYDIVAFARSKHILCQGRGSAANSAVCYALGITEVNPAESELLFGRFISRERDEPPDIDVDFEHQRREEVIQYIYAKYGQDRAALTATVITYRTRSALRDTGRALFGNSGIDIDKINALTSSLAWWDKPDQWPERFAAVGLDPQSPRVRKWLVLARQIRGHPRHLSQHVGGFVISRDRLDRLVPIEKAAMAGRSVIQWDKDDIEALHLMKVDVLALGMLSAIRRMLDMLARRTGRHWRMQDIPHGDKGVYDMICKADTIGVFQIESRAQMSMLPRLRPKAFYDLVIQVAIVRPGPIQGDMVHPYLRRRQGLEPVKYWSKAVEGVLERTLGVPIFQEQVMQLSMVAAGFSADEADQLRRAMAAWKKRGGLEPFQEKLIRGMTERGYPLEFAERLFEQIKGFGDYGFPESHAASFAILVYFSAWIKHHHPDVFLCGLLNSQPMGFYSPAQLVQDAQRHRVMVKPVDVTMSDYDSMPEAGGVRVGLHQISSLNKEAGERITAARRHAPFANVNDLARRAQLARRDLDTLAAAGALASLAGHRREAAWVTAAVPVQRDLLLDAPIIEMPPALPTPSEGDDIVADYDSLRLTLGRHPLALLRQRLNRKRYIAAESLKQLQSGALARCVGIVTGRQRPGTASGVIFVTLEDETGYTNVIVHAHIAQRQRRELLDSRLLGVLGVLQREGEVIHLIAKRLVDHSELLGRLRTGSRDFH